MIRIEFLSGDSRGRIEAIDSAPFLIGRGPECEVCIDPQNLDKDLQVSAKHVKIQVNEESGQYELLDVSKNGTFVNDKKVENKVSLTKFTTVQLGPGGPRLKLTVEDTNVISLGTKKLQKKDYVPIKTTSEMKAPELHEIETPKKKGCGGKAAVLLIAAVTFAIWALRS